MKTWLILFILSLILVMLAAWLFKWVFNAGDSSRTGKTKEKDKGPSHSNCPLCNSALFAGENLVSRVYKGCDPKDQACTILGCPYCYPVPRPGIKRVCPVCHKTVPPNGHLDAHLFLRNTGKRHVHITGCTECHKRNK